MKTQKKSRLVAIVVFVSLLCATIFYLGPQTSPVRHPENFTTPLKSEDVAYLCTVFSLSDDDERCQAGSSVYAPDFFDEIDRMVKKGELESFTQWQKKFGRYEFYCPGKKTEVYQCDYDFHGDDIIIIYAYFDADNAHKVKEWGIAVSDD
jgi:hypothetical protein